VNVRRTGLLVAAALAPVAAGAAQVPKSEYLRYVPLRAQKIVRQTEASARLHLYGDPADPLYRDQAPRDGVDDARMRRLQALAVRFAPLLVRNTPLFPMSFKAFWKEPSFPLHVDTWDISRAEAALVREEQIDFARLAQRPCAQAQAVGAEADPREAWDSDDCRLLELLREFNPPAPASEQLTTTVIAPEREPFKVLYFDTPGDSEESWKQVYWPKGREKRRREWEGTQKAYAHPVISEVRGRQGELLGYELAIQYWLFYPVNDGGNNHEGDWEHLNVVVSPLSRVTDVLSAEQVEQLLSDTRPFDGDDPLVMRRVEYYFHQQVYLMDFSRPNAYRPLAEWEREAAALGESVEGERWIWQRIRQRAWRDAAQTQVNTRPVGWIGGDGLGLAQLIATPGGKDQDSHGTYPFRGLYRNVGPTAAGERVQRSFDFEAYLSGREPLPDDVEDLARPERIEILPDWERVIDLVFEDPAVRREWAWMLLPIRFGYPAMESPGAGIIGHADTGNLAVFGPTYNPGWNRLGDADSFSAYEPHKLSWAIPLGVIDNFQPKAGFLNAPIALGLTIPPIDLIWRVAALPVRAAVGDRNPVFTPSKQLPSRAMSLEGGLTLMRGDEDLTLLLTNRDQFIQILVRAAAILPPGGQLVDLKPVVETATAPYFTVSFHLGDRFTSENTLTNARSTAGWDIAASGVPGGIPIRGTLNLWEYHGVFRYNLSRSAFRPYLKLGYGLTWYRIENVSVAGDVLETPDSPWVRKPGFWHDLWPNTLVTGAGIDWTGVRFGSASAGFKIGYTLAHHRIGFEQDAAVELGGELAKKLAGQRFYTWRQELTLQATLSF